MVGLPIPQRSPGARRQRLEGVASPPAGEGRFVPRALFGLSEGSGWSRSAGQGDTCVALRPAMATLISRPSTGPCRVSRWGLAGAAPLPAKPSARPFDTIRRNLIGPWLRKRPPVTSRAPGTSARRTRRPSSSQACRGTRASAPPSSAPRSPSRHARSRSP